MTRFVNTILLLAIIAGIYVLLRDHDTLAEVRTRRDQLAAKYGELKVKDTDKYLITRIDTGDPAHFLWRCYYPEQLNVQERQSFGTGGRTSGSSTHSSAGEFLHRCRFSFDDQHLSAHVMDRGGGGRLGISDPILVAFMKDHWNELEFQVLAEQGTMEISTDEVLSFLTIRIPEHLLQQIQDFGSSRYLQKRLSSGNLFEMQYGTQESFEIFDADASSRESTEPNSADGEQ